MSDYKRNLLEGRNYPSILDNPDVKIGVGLECLFKSTDSDLMPAVSGYVCGMIAQHGKGYSITLKRFPPEVVVDSSNSADDNGEDVFLEEVVLYRVYSKPNDRALAFDSDDEREASED